MSKAPEIPAVQATRALGGAGATLAGELTREDDADILDRTVAIAEGESERTVVVDSRAGVPLSAMPGLSSQDPLLGATLEGKYRLDAPLGSGGTGRVYLARQLSLGRVVAIKVMRPELDPDGEQRFEERFFREASMAGALQHPNVVTVHDFGRTADGLCFIVMELLGGVSFKELLRGGPMEIGRCVGLFEQVVRGLRHAHKAGLIHRDMKPGNIQILPGDEGLDHVKILDFGLVKGEGDVAITQHGTFLGTPHYAPPEQVRGEDTNPRSDLYSVGVMMYRALTGKLPYGGETAVAVAMAHVREPYPPMAERAPNARVPAEVEAVVRRCMAKAPADRYPDADALLIELINLRRRYAPDQPSVVGSAAITEAAAEVPAAPPAPPPLAIPIEAPPAPAPQGRSGLWMAALLGLFGLVGLLGLGTLGGMALWGGGAEDEAGALVLAPGAVAVVEEAEAPAAPTTRVVALAITSAPPGAEVRAGGLLLGLTPLEHSETVDLNAAEPFLDLELRLAGHEPATRRVLLSGESAALAVALTPLPVPKPEAPRPAVEKAAPVPSSTPTPRPVETRAPAPSGRIVDGVAFTAAEAEATLRYLNSATAEQIREAGVVAHQTNLIVAGRPWASVEAFGATPQIGEKTVRAVYEAAR